VIRCCLRRTLRESNQQQRDCARRYPLAMISPPARISSIHRSVKRAKPAKREGAPRSRSIPRRHARAICRWIDTETVFKSRSVVGPPYCASHGFGPRRRRGSVSIWWKKLCARWQNERQRADELITTTSAAVLPFTTAWSRSNASSRQASDRCGLLTRWCENQLPGGGRRTVVRALTAPVFDTGFGASIRGGCIGAIRLAVPDPWRPREVRCRRCAYFSCRAIPNRRKKTGNTCPFQSRERAIAAIGIDPPDARRPQCETESWHNGSASKGAQTWP